MQAIQTRYLSASNVKGSRVKAFCPAGSLTLEYDDTLSANANHELVATKLAEKLGWIQPYYGAMVGGTLKNGDRVFTFALRERPVHFYEVEAGRTVSIDGVRSFYINIVTEPRSGAYAMHPHDADQLTRKIADLLNKH